MAHSSDRTLLASLGFQDPDISSKTHTLACQYLCEPEVTAKLARLLWPAALAEEPDPRTTRVNHGEYDRVHYPSDPPDVWDVVAGHAEAEVAIRRDRRFLIGFWDVGLRFDGRRLTWEHKSHEFLRPKPASGGYHSESVRGEWADYAASRVNLFASMPCQWSTNVLVEVKAGVVDVASIARQVETYRTGEPAIPTIASARDRSRHEVIVATCWPMSTGDRATLSAKNIRHIYLSDAFNAYCKRREQDESGGDSL